MTFSLGTWGSMGVETRSVEGPVRLSVQDLLRRFRCSRATLERWLRRGLLPPARYLLQRRVWELHEIEAAENELHQRHTTSLGGVSGAAAARRAAAAMAEAKALAELEAAAAAYLG